jgi:hypothetical protein|tara:strand:- start:336 stop:791 length:456 start_codon:yes stop_codon:yes gene_type:complete
VKYFFFFIIISTTNVAYSELLKPQANFLPGEVIFIQLTALQNNNHPYQNAGIEQTWKFAHPSNKQYTGPLSNFIKMMHSDSYSIMINHKKHNINLVEQGVNISFFMVELVDKTDNKFGIQWIVEKVLLKGELKNCWMTVSVSQPVLIAKSA